MNVIIEEARAGYARVSMSIRDDMLNGHRIAHGGMVFALADTAFAYVCNGRNERAVAAQASIVFLAAAAPASFAAEAVTFQTNWLAQAEHGGFYQAVATGIYKKYGLDVTVKMGGPPRRSRKDAFIPYHTPHSGAPCASPT